MVRGVIKKIVTERGFGFIGPDRSGGEGGRKDVFFHFSAVQGVRFEELHEGEAVEYELLDSPDDPRGAKGPRAASVKPA